MLRRINLCLSNSLVGSVLTYSTVALRTSRVRIMTRGPFPNLPPLLSPTSLPVSSDLSYRNKGENDKKNKKLIICKYSKYHGQLISRSAPSRVRVGSHTHTHTHIHTGSGMRKKGKVSRHAFIFFIWPYFILSTVRMPCHAWDITKDKRLKHNII